MEKTISIFKEALKNITSNKLRSGLTMLGLIIGIMSVILLVGIGTGATSNITSSVKSLGTGTLSVTINKDSENAVEYDELQNFKEMTRASLVAPNKTVSATVSRDNVTSRNANIIATTTEYKNIMNLKLEARKMDFKYRYRKHK